MLIAKIAGIKLCESLYIQYGINAISLMPCNLFGPGDNYDLSTSHVLPALIRKFQTAKIIIKIKLNAGEQENIKRIFIC